MTHYLFILLPRRIIGVSETADNTTDLSSISKVGVRDLK
jgi:hypothetical protein